MSERTSTPERYDEMAEYVLDPNNRYRSDISPVEVAAALRELAAMKRRLSLLESDHRDCQSPQGLSSGCGLYEDLFFASGEKSGATS